MIELMQGTSITLLGIGGLLHSMAVARLRKRIEELENN
jgi:hypothetical protein